ncbi:uncharacterized protein PgNI_00518, partial [Pyricularia grisea]|uniref:Uncharacterized protein n=1 Tax=Pyricularia grisea TaxID=148305 RepID=A0A6P8BHV4_PYRGI
CVQGGLTKSTRRHSTYCITTIGPSSRSVPRRLCVPTHLQTKASSAPWQAAPLSSDEVSLRFSVLARVGPVERTY